MKPTDIRLKHFPPSPGHRLSLQHNAVRWCLFLILFTTASILPAAPPGRIKVLVERGSVEIIPAGAERSLEVTKSFILCPGDRLRPTPSALVFVQTESSSKTPLKPGYAYKMTTSALVDSMGHTVVSFSTAKDRVSSQPSALSSPTADLAGTVAPIDGEVHMKEAAWTGWVRLPHRSSFTWGASFDAAPDARLEINTNDGTLIRAVGPLSFTLEKSLLTFRHGTLLLQMSGEKREKTIKTPAVTIELKGTLIEVEAQPAQGSTLVRLHAGVARLSSPDDAADGRQWSRYLSASRELAVKPDAFPGKPSRFDRKKALRFFTEGWKPEGPGASFLPRLEGNSLLRQLRADQKPEIEPEQDDRHTSRTRAKNAAWLRLRLRSMDSVSNRRHYLAFRRYAKARSVREEYEKTMSENAAKKSSGSSLAPGHIPGGRTTRTRQARLRLLRWRERRLAMKLDKLETKLANQDWAYSVDREENRKKRLRGMRERAYGQDLRLQTRRLFKTTRDALNQKGARISDINSQIILLSGIPGNEALIRSLQRERARLLDEADKLKDSLEELVELH